MSRAAGILQGLKGGAAAPLVVLGMLAMVTVPAVADRARCVLHHQHRAVARRAAGGGLRQGPLEFSIFPSVLLMVTLLRLALNVASTRVVLLHGHQGEAAAGHVIESFGQFVIGGSYAVGLVVVRDPHHHQLRGGDQGRGTHLRSVGTLHPRRDARKQMAIDADLNAACSRARKPRRARGRAQRGRLLRLDGRCGKFVRGDAIAGLLILAIN